MRTCWFEKSESQEAHRKALTHTSNPYADQKMWKCMEQDRTSRMCPWECETGEYENSWKHSPTQKWLKYSQVHISSASVALDKLTGGGLAGLAPFARAIVAHRGQHQGKMVGLDQTKSKECSLPMHSSIRLARLADDARRGGSAHSQCGESLAVNLGSRFIIGQHCYYSLLICIKICCYCFSSKRNVCEQATYATYCPWALRNVHFRNVSYFIDLMDEILGFAWKQEKEPWMCAYDYDRIWYVIDTGLLSLCFIADTISLQQRPQLSQFLKSYAKHRHPWNTDLKHLRVWIPIPVKRRNCPEVVDKDNNSMLSIWSL